LIFFRLEITTFNQPCKVGNLQSIDINSHRIVDEITFSDRTQVLTCVSDKLRSGLLPVTYDKLLINDINI
jgi:hypothetical protein